MRGIISFAAVLTLAATGLADGWMLKAPYEAKAKLTWNVTVNANVGGQDHEAKFKNVLEIVSKSETEIKGSGTWTDLTLDGNDQNGGGEQPKWDLVLKPDGSITSAGESADYARMLVPFSFVYPGKEVKTGDKWTAKFKPKDGKDVTVDYEIVEQGKVGDADALRVKGKISEDGPMKGEATYWLGKDGRVLKLEADIKQWTVPFAGADTNFDAKIKAELAKA